LSALAVVWSDGIDRRTDQQSDHRPLADGSSQLHPS
jgi:hypothetical protein